MHSIFLSPAIHQTSQAQNCGNTKDPSAMIPRDDLKPKKTTQKVQPGEDMDDEELPEEPDDSQPPADSDSGDSGPTKYKPDSDSGDSGTEVPRFLPPRTRSRRNGTL